MKKYINPIPDGGAPLHNNRLNVELGIEIWDAIEGLLTKFSLDTQGVIISGCVSSGGPYTVSAGIVYIDGKFRRVPATSGLSGTKYITSGADVNTPKTFGDGLSKNLIVDQVGTVASAIPGAGQYITVDVSNIQAARKLNNWYDIVADLVTNLAYKPLSASQGVALKALIDAEVTNRIADVDAEETARINAINSEAASRIATDALKANKSQSAWVDITIRTAQGWSTPAFDKFQYRIDEFGKIHFRGTVSNSGGDYKVCAAGAVPAPPTSTSVYIVKPYTAGGGGAFVGFCFIQIEDDGAVYISNSPQWVSTAAINAQVQTSGSSYWQ